MAQETYELGRASGILADAVGQPGNRRFRILARNDYELANLWVEREQLQAMALAIQKLLQDVSSLPADYEDPDHPPREGPLSFDLRPNLEFQVGQLALGYEEQRRLFMILAHDVAGEQNAEPAFSCLVNRPQLQAFGQAVFALVAAGRDRCPLCGRPIDVGSHDHFRSNGHHKPASI